MSFNLFSGEVLEEGGFVEDGDTEFLGFFVFGSGGFSGEEVVGLFAHARAGASSCGFDSLGGLIAGEGGEAAGEDEGLAG